MFSEYGNVGTQMKGGLVFGEYQRERPVKEKLAIGEQNTRNVFKKGKETRMKGILKKLHQKTAVALVASMLVTSALPITGLAKTYDIGGIYDEDQDIELYGDGVSDLSDYRATASVATEVTGENELSLTDGSGEVELTATYDITLYEVASASDTVASPTNWEDVNEALRNEILQKLSVTATISNADEAIEGCISRGYISLDDSNLAQEGKVTLLVENMPSDLRDKAYSVTVTVTPELREGVLGENINVNSITSGSHIVTIKADSGSVTGTSSVKLSGFHEDDSDGKTWIYVGDDSVDLHDYCAVTPDGAKVVFKSNKPEVASVSDAGELTPVSKGEATITAEVIATDNYASSEATMVVDVWAYEDMKNLPPSFEIYEGSEWEYVFPDIHLAHDGFTCVLDENDEEVSKDIVDLDFHDNSTRITVAAKKAGNYKLRLAYHGGERVTYRGVVDFTVLPSQNADFRINGFHNETDDDKGITGTWIYIENGSRYLPGFCENVPEGAKLTFTSSDDTVAMIEDGYLIGVGTGKATITATMEAPGYRMATDTLIVEVWKYENWNNLPDSVTIYEGETWSRTFAAPLDAGTEFFVYGEYGDVVDDTLKLTVSEDKSSITIEAKKPGLYELSYSYDDKRLMTTYDEWMEIVVLEAGVSLDLSADQLVIEPGKSASFDVKYSPENAEIELNYIDNILDADYADGKVTVTSIGEDSSVSYLHVHLLDEEGEPLVVKTVQVIVAEKQLEATTVTGALAEANDKVKEAVENGNKAEIYKIVNEIVEIIADAPQSEVSTDEVKENIDKLEEELSRVATVENEVHDDDIEIETSGALLNLLSKGETEGKMVVVPLEDTSNTAGVTLDIKLQKGSTGDNITKLAVPMQIRVKVSGIDLTKNVRIRHTKENGSAKWIYPDIDGEYIVFWVDSFSKFAISNYTTGGNGGGGGGGGGSATGNSAAGTISSDAKKGYVNSVTGIVTGSGTGYSNWAQDEAGWKLQYADGTFAAGVMGTDENGNSYEQVAWEMVNGAWYPFGANGYVKSGLVYDVALAGTFYVDINSGMKTGWQSVDGVWRYFNTVSDGKRGIMLTNTTVDGRYIDAEGVWRETAE